MEEYVILTLGIAVICWRSGYVVGSAKNSITGKVQAPQPWPCPPKGHQPTQDNLDRNNPPKGGL